MTKKKETNDKTYGMQQKQFKREVYSNTILPQETRKTSNRQPHFTPKTTGKRTKNRQLVDGKKIRKIQAEINEKEMKEQ